VYSRAQAWYGRRTWDWRDYPADVLLAGKRRVGARISVVIPARDEEQTVANVVGSLRAALVERIPLVDEVVVIDSDSADGTATAAARAVNCWSSSMPTSCSPERCPAGTWPRKSSMRATPSGSFTWSAGSLERR
jgi:hypothetical protein